MEREVHATALCDRGLAAQADRRLLASPVEARLEPPAQLDLAGEPFDASCQLTPGHQPAALQRQRLGDENDAVARRVDRLENVGPLDVSALDVEATGGLQDE